MVIEKYTPISKDSTTLRQAQWTLRQAQCESKNQTVSVRIVEIFKSQIAFIHRMR